MPTLIDPKNITDYNRTDEQLQTFWIFCVLVAGKNSDTTSRLVTKLLSTKRPDQTPFDFIQEFDIQDFNNFLISNKVGQYSRITKALYESSYLDLKTCTRHDLMNIHGVGPKTARFFLLHTREFCDEIVLDTHILRWLRDKCHLVGIPNNTPQDPKKYEYLADVCKNLMQKHYPGMTLAQIDLLIWTMMSGRLD